MTKRKKTSVVEAEKRTNRVSIDSEVFELPLSSFVLEPDYADITNRLRLMSQPVSLFSYYQIANSKNVIPLE